MNKAKQKLIDIDISMAVTRGKGSGGGRRGCKRGQIYTLGGERTMQYTGDVL